MADLKTKKNRASVSKFISSIENETRRNDAKELLKIFQEVTKMKPAMWGTSIIGYGSYHYKYASGREGDWMLTGFSPRKQSTSIYIMSGFNIFPELMKKLGKHKTGVGCLYINKLADIDTSVLKQLIKKSVSYTEKRYNT